MKALETIFKAVISFITALFAKKEISKGEHPGQQLELSQQTEIKEGNMDKTLANFLWNARWGIKNGHYDHAYQEVTKALEHIGAEKPTTPVTPPEPTKPTPTTPIKGIKEPEFVVVKGACFKDRGHYSTPSGMFSGMTVHYTVSPYTAAKGVLEWLISEGLGCMVMHGDGKIYIPEFVINSKGEKTKYDILKHWGHHSGKSKWKGRESVSDIFAGMEICCWGLNSKEGPYRTSKGEENIIAGKYQVYTPEQEASLTNFILWMRTKNPEFKLENVVGHDELRAEYGLKGDKQDPGASLSMTMPKYREYLKEQEKKVRG